MPLPLRPGVVWRCLFDSEKMTLLEDFDMHLIFFVIFSQHFNIFSQCLVTYLGTWGQGLAWGGRFGLSRGPGPPGITVERRVTYRVLALAAEKSVYAWQIWNTLRCIFMGTFLGIMYPALISN